MKKFFAILLVLVLTVTCFAGCSPKQDDGSALGNALNQLSQFGDAAGLKMEMNMSATVSFDDAVLSDASLNQLLGEKAAALLPLLSLFVKDDKTAELAISAQSVSNKEGDTQALVTIGKGENALTCTSIAADGDVFVDMKTIYNWAGNLLAPAMGGEKLPVWPYQNAYVSLQDLMLVMQGGERIETGGTVAASMAYPNTEMVQPGAGVSQIAGLNPEMLEAVVKGLKEAIPEQTLAELVSLVETALKEAGMLTVKDGFVTITVSGNNIEALPDALAEAAEGKLGSIIDRVVAGIRNSDNEIIASMIPASEEINGKEMEDEFIAAMQGAKDDFKEAAQEMKKMNLNVTMGIKAGKKSAEYRISAGLRIEDESGIAGNVSLNLTSKIETTKDVSVRAPGNVMTETELSDFLSVFTQNMG